MQEILFIYAFVICCFISVLEGRTVGVLSVSMVEIVVELEEGPVELPSPSPVPSESSNIDNLVTP
jgi:hypothetical protein